MELLTAILLAHPSGRKWKQTMAAGKGQWYIKWTSSGKYEGDIETLARTLEEVEDVKLTFKLVTPDKVSISEDMFIEQIWGATIPMSLSEEVPQIRRNIPTARGTKLKFTILDNLLSYSFTAVVSVVEHLLAKGFYKPSPDVERQLAYSMETKRYEQVSGTACQFEDLLPERFRLGSSGCEGYDSITYTELEPGFVTLRCGEQAHCFNLSTLASLFETLMEGETPLNPYTREPFTKEQIQYILSRGEQYNVNMYYDPYIEKFIKDLYVNNYAADFLDSVIHTYNNLPAFAEEVNRSRKALRQRIYNDYYRGGMPLLRSSRADYENDIYELGKRLYILLGQAPASQITNNRGVLAFLSERASRAGLSEEADRFLVLSMR